MNATLSSADPSKPPSRRDFLRLTVKAVLYGSGLLVVSGIARFLGYQPNPTTPSSIDLGLVSDFPPGTRKVFPQVQAVVMYTASGIRAFSLVCPHLGCQVNETPDGFLCPCHGSRFNPSGGLISGPAVRSLDPLVIEVQDGRLILYRRG